jgi:hypothetical protein
VSRRFNWTYASIAQQQYLKGNTLIAESTITKAGDIPVDGPEFDPFPQLDARNFSISAWMFMDRLPALIDPFGVYASEQFSIFSRSSSAGADSSSPQLVIRGNAAGPRIQLGIQRAVSSAVSNSIAGSLPLLTAGKWVFIGASYAAGGAGPQCFVGDLATPVAEVTYQTRTDGAGINGINNPGLSAAGQWIDRWGFGPILLGTMTLPVPPNGPNQSYGLLGPTNSGFDSMQGLLADVTVWGGVLSVSQLEKVRTAVPASRLALPAQGFPPLLADWWLTESGDVVADHSGNNHTLLAVLSTLGPALPSDPPAPRSSNMYHVPIRVATTTALAAGGLQPVAGLPPALAGAAFQDVFTSSAQTLAAGASQTVSWPAVPAGQRGIVQALALTSSDPTVVTYQTTKNGVGVSPYPTAHLGSLGTLLNPFTLPTGIPLVAGDVFAIVVTNTGGAPITFQVRSIGAFFS